MYDVKITAVKISTYPELSKRYENPILHTCDIKEGDEFISVNHERPDGFCDSAWHTIYPYVFALANGAQDFYDGWMKNPNTAMISCSDGFRPVSFLLERI